MTSHETHTHAQTPRRDAGLTDIFGSMLGFATAGTRFTFQQMQNAMEMVTDPQCVMNRMRDSLDNISNAMTQPTDTVKVKSYTAEPLSADDFRDINGRKV